MVVQDKNKVENEVRWMCLTTKLFIWAIFTVLSKITKFLNRNTFSRFAIKIPTGTAGRNSPQSWQVEMWNRWKEVQHPIILNWKQNIDISYLTEALICSVSSPIKMRQYSGGFQQKHRVWCLTQHIFLSFQQTMSWNNPNGIFTTLD